MILVTGEEDRARMIKMGRRPESVYAVRGGVDLSIPASVPEPAEKEYDAVFIGRLHPQKGVRELLQIWQMLAGEKPDAKLAVIGVGQQEAELKQQVRNLGLDCNVTFCGFKDGVEKYQIIKSSRVVVHPAIYDSGGMAAAEALACGLPGVAFDLPSLETYYPKGFIKIPQGGLYQFSKAILSLLSDKNLYHQMSSEALEVAKDWDWNIRAEELRNAIAKEAR
jgi:glycosyltransferase involved in cell wall biosynthesis